MNPLNHQHVPCSCRQPLGLTCWSLSAGPAPDLPRSLFRQKDRGARIVVVPGTCKIISAK